MDKRLIAGLALAGSFALALPLAALAQDGERRADGPRERAGQMHHGKHGHWHGKHGHWHGKHAHRHGPGMHGAGPDMRMGRAMMARLDLTDAQRTQLAELRKAQVPAMREQARALHEARRELGKLGFSGDFDEAKARELGERSARASADLAVLRAKAANDFYQVLTPEQREKFSKRMARLEKRGERRPGARGENPRGPGERRGDKPAAEANRS